MSHWDTLETTWHHWGIIWTTFDHYMGQLGNNCGTTLGLLLDTFETSLRQLWNNQETTLENNFGTTLWNYLHTLAKWENFLRFLWQLWHSFETNLGQLRDQLVTAKWQILPLPVGSIWPFIHKEGTKTECWNIHIFLFSIHKLCPAGHCQTIGCWYIWALVGW